MRLLFKYFRLSAEVRRTIHQVGLLLILTRLGLVLLPYRVVRGWFDRWGSHVVREGSPEYEKLLTWAGSGLGRYMLGDKPCLTQALVVQGLLRRAGRDVEMKIGVARSKNGPIQAHAWLEREGRVILGGRRASRKYATLAPLTGDSVPDDVPHPTNSVARLPLV